MPDHLGLRIATARLHKELSQEHLAAAAGIARNTLSNLEAGVTDGNFGTVRQLALLLGVSLDYLAGFTDDPTPASQRVRPPRLVVSAGRL